MNKPFTTCLSAFIFIVCSYAGLAQAQNHTPANGQKPPLYKPAYREFKDWVVACNNTGTCFAQSAGEENTFDMTVERRAGATGLMAFTLYGRDGNKPKPNTLGVDGNKLPWNAKDWQLEEEGYFLVNRNTPSILKLIDGFKNGNTLQQTVSHSTNANLSLNGLSASLLFIDDYQKRLKTPTAFIRRGNEPEKNIPAAAPLPSLRTTRLPVVTLSEKQAAQLIKAVRKNQAKLLREENYLSEHDEAIDQVYALNKTEALVVLEHMRGAYQSSSMVFRTPVNAPEQAKRLILSLPDAFTKGYQKNLKVNSFTEAYYDTKTGLLSFSAKGRGLADCGESASWQFDGKNFQLAGWHYMGRCTGGDPGNWLPLWVSEEQG